MKVSNHVCCRTDSGKCGRQTRQSDISGSFLKKKGRPLKKKGVSWKKCLSPEKKVSRLKKKAVCSGAYTAMNTFILHKLIGTIHFVSMYDYKTGLNSKHGRFSRKIVILCPNERRTSHSGSPFVCNDNTIMRLRFLAVAASLLISSIAAIYPNDHWSYSTQLTEENFESTVQTEIEAGRTLFVRLIASPTEDDERSKRLCGISSPSRLRGTRTSPLEMLIWWKVPSTNCHTILAKVGRPFDTSARIQESTAHRTSSEHPMTCAPNWEIWFTWLTILTSPSKLNCDDSQLEQPGTSRNVGSMGCVCCCQDIPSTCNSDGSILDVSRKLGRHHGRPTVYLQQECQSQDE